MLRQSSSRNHRSRGLKLKKALQISLLVLVSVWLLYQVKHSYEKKTAVYNENNDNNDTSDVHNDDQSQDEVIRLGRKDLPAKMEADSSTLDERVEDEETEEIEQEMKHDEHDDDPIDEPDLDKDDDLPEPGEHSADKDEGSDGVGVFEDEERKERSQEDQEKSFHGDDVSSAVTHDPPSALHDELTHHAQEKILFVDDASTAVPHEKQEPEHKEEARKATEGSSTVDDVSSSVDHDARIAKPLPDEQLKSMDKIFEGTANLSNGITFQGPGMNGTDAAGEHAASSTNPSSNPNLSTPSLVSESKSDPAAANLTSNDAGSEISNSTSLKGQHEQQVNSTAALNSQAQLLTDLTSAELNSPPNGTLALVSTDPQKATSRDGDNGGNTGTSSMPVNNSADDVDVSTKIMNKAIGEGEVLPE